jgi:hypothetical protein
MRSAGMPVIGAAHAGVWAARCAASRAKPTVWRATKSCGGFRLAHVDGDDVRPAAPRGGEVAARVRLARQIRSPVHDEVRVGAHVLLGVRLEQPGEAQAEAAERPADDGRAPPLAAVEVREAPQQVRVDARAVVVGEDPVAGPCRDGLAAGRAHARDDEIERLVPRRPPPRPATRRADHRIEQALFVAENLGRRLAAHAEEAAAVGVVGVAAHARDAPVLDLHEHPAERRVAVHRAHRPVQARHVA